MSLNRSLLKFTLCGLAFFFYTLNCFITFYGEIVYTIDFFLIFLVIFYVISKSQKFKSSYFFLANGWGNYVTNRTLLFNFSSTAKNASTTIFGLAAVRQLICTETSVTGKKIVDSSIKTNLIATLV